MVSGTGSLGSPKSYSVTRTVTEVKDCLTEEQFKSIHIDLISLGRSHIDSLSF